jgi:peptide-methionine (S)-S-oxide reductase
MDRKKVFHNKLLSLEDGSYDVVYNKKRYLLSKETKLNSKLIKLYAKELGDNDFISLNYYTEKLLLKPCEMPEQKVIDFVVNLQLDKEHL